MSDTMHVNNFERDLDYKNHTGIMTNDFANMEYRYDSTGEKLVEDYDKIGEFVWNHVQYQAPRLKLLMDYYKGLTFNIKRRSDRRQDKAMADNRASHDYAAYIADFSNGYFLGNPIDYVIDDENIKEYIDEFHKSNDIKSHNRSLGLDLSIYGRAYEYVIRNEKDKVKVYKCDAERTFIIYDNTIEKNSIAAVRYYPVTTLGIEDEQAVTYIIEVVIDNGIYRYKTTDTARYMPERNYDYEAHSFGKVSITEYRANELRIGDFEKVISLIDLMDAAQSDTANYMSDLNDALLLLIGNFKLSPDAAEMQKKARILHLERPEYKDSDNRVTEGNVQGDYIYKKYDVSGTEAYKNRLDNSIHTFTNTPNMGDEKFAGNQSGESMKYKLMSLEQRAIIKEGLFEKALRRRYSLVENIAQINSELSNDQSLKDMSFKFKRNLPKSLIEELQAYINAGGEISMETLMMLFSFIPDVKMELEKIAEEKKLQMNEIDSSAYPGLGEDKQTEE